MKPTRWLALLRLLQGTCSGPACPQSPSPGHTCHGDQKGRRRSPTPLLMGTANLEESGSECSTQIVNLSKYVTKS
jgi:hypothetical protein